MTPLSGSQNKALYARPPCHLACKHTKLEFFFQWNLICGKEYYASLSQSILFIGWIPGAFIIGRLSDKFGRKRLLFPAVFCVVSTSFASSFVSVLWYSETLLSIFISFCSSNKFKLHPTIYTLVLVFLSGCSWLFEESQVSFKVEFTSPCMFSQRNLLDRSIAISLGPLCGCFIQVL